MFPLDGFLCFSGEERVVRGCWYDYAIFSWEEDDGLTIWFFPRREDLGMINILFVFFSIYLNFLFPIWCPVVTGPGMWLQVSETGMIPRQEIVTIVLHLYVRIPKGLAGQVVPSFYLTKSRLTLESSYCLVVKKKKKPSSLCS